MASVDDDSWHQEAHNSQTKNEVQRRQQNLKQRQKEGGGPERQPDGQPIQQRTVEQQEKSSNLIALQRREAGLETNRSRSTSRRDRRKRLQKAIDDGRHLKTGSLRALEEADADGDLQAMQPFQRIGPDSTSMDGPVTHTRAMRGEIPVRGSDPRQPKYLPRKQEKGSDLKDTDGLKLTLEANLEIEIELKASIRGDLTLSLL